jgi:hypothetical protein
MNPSGGAPISITEAANRYLSNIVVLVDPADVTQADNRISKFNGTGNVTQSNSSYQPVLYADIPDGLGTTDPALNNRAAAYYHATSQGNGFYTEFNDLSALTEGEGFYVWRVTADPPATNLNAGGSGRIGSAPLDNVHYPYTNGNVYESWGITGYITVGNPTPSLTTKRIYNVWSAAADWGCKLDNTTLYTDATKTVGFSASPRFGRGVTDNDYNFTGYLGCLVICSSKQSTTNRNNFLSWLSTWFNITIA